MSKDKRGLGDVNLTSQLKRAGKNRPNNNELIYLLRGVPRIHHNDNFIEIKSNK